ncbi:N-acetyl sugar amidotransferase [Candidatus Pelagibacter sp.]|jgi:N-acetyl sugar amidotransferase|nr:N-acetyl sugar amidotransferase [Candidatus Pelagibacter sp.]
MKNVVWCSNCLNMSTRPRISFDERGFCNACVWMEEKKNLDWSSRLLEFENVINEIKSKKKKYDVLVPVSGGKDGSYVAYQLKHKFNLNSLSVTIRPPLELEIGKQNLVNFVNSGFEHFHVTTNFEAMQKLDKQGFIHEGQGYYGWLISIHTAVLRVAQMFDIDLIVYGEDGEIEYGGSLDYKNKGFYGVDYMKKVYLNDTYGKLLKLSNLNENEKFWFTFPEEINPNLKVTHFSFFENWDPYRNYLTAKKYCGLSDIENTNTGTFTNFAQNDQLLASLHYYLMFLKFGFGRATQDAGIEIRRGALDREQGKNLIRVYDGIFPKENIPYYLKYFDLSEKDFIKIIDSWANKDILHKVGDEWKLKIDIN